MSYAQFASFNTCRAGDRGSARAAAHVVQANFAEIDGFWIDAVFAANTGFPVLTSASATVAVDIHPLGNTSLANCLSLIGPGRIRFHGFSTGDTVCRHQTVRQTVS
ncbi:MAG: hypothetical protein ACI8P0_000734 [Planctomycetaceae bacterium]|jgi:hypothetical protein